MASRGESTFAVNIVGNVKGLERDLKAAGRWTEDLREKIDQLKDQQIQLKGERALAQLNAIGGEAQSLSGKLKGLFSGQAEQALQQYAQRLGPVGELLTGVGTSGLVAAGAIGAVGLAVGKSIQTFTALASEVASFKRITGATAEDSSRLVAVLDDVGISAESGAKAFAQLAKNLDSKAFAATGVEIGRTKSGAADLSATFLNVSRRLEGIKDPAERANILIAAFGRQGEALGPIFDRGTEAIERMMKANEGQVLTDEDLRQAREFKDAMDALGDVAKEAELALAKIVLPPLTAALEDLATMAGWLDKIGSFKVGENSVLGTIFKSIPGVGALGVLGDAWDKISGGTKRATDASKEAAAAERERADATAKANEATAAGLQAKLDQIRLEDRITSAKKAVADAQERVTEVERAGAEKIQAAKDKILELDRKRVEVAKNVQSAQEKLAAASQNLTVVQQRENDVYFRYLQVLGKAQVDVKELADAQRDLADAQGRVTDLAEREADARRSLADAQRELAKDVVRMPAEAERNVAQARRDQVRATERLAELEAKRGDSALTARERATLELDIADARDQVEEASWRVADAEEALANVHDRLTRKAEDLVSKERDLADIHNEQADAAQGVIDAEGKLVEVRDGSQPGSARAVEAEKQLAEARAATKDATDKVTEAQDNLTKAMEAQEGLPAKIAAAQKNLRDVEQEVTKARVTAAESVNTALRAQKTLLLEIQTEAAKAGEAIPGSLDAAIPSVPGTGVLLPGGSTVVTSGGRKAVAPSSSTGKTGGSRSWRNNNPGNIKFGQFAKSHGATGQDSGGFAIFPTMEAGAAAQEALLFGGSYRNLSIAAALEKYSPAADNNPHNAARIADVSRSTGVSASTRLSDLTPAQRKKFLDAVTRTEGFKAGQELIQKFGGSDTLDELEETGRKMGDAVVDGMSRQMMSGIDITAAASKALVDQTAAKLDEAKTVAITKATATIKTLKDLYAEFAKQSNNGQAALDNLNSPARYVGGKNADGSNIIVHAFAANPVYGGTLFDKHGRQVYADDAEGIREALQPDNPYLNAPPSMDHMLRATPRGGVQNFAKGGIVTGETFARIGEAGPEAVIPLSSPMAANMLGGNVTVNVAGTVITERDLVDHIRKALIVAQQRGQTLVV